MKQVLKRLGLGTVLWAVCYALAIPLLPFAHQTIPQYFMQLGIEYVGMMAPVIAIGYLLDKKTGGIV